MRDLMAARRAVKDAKSVGEQKTEAEAHRAIDAAKEALGERGPADGEGPNLNRHMVKNTSYAPWYAHAVVEGGGRSPTGLRRIASDSHWQLSTH